MVCYSENYLNSGLKFIQVIHCNSNGAKLLAPDYSIQMVGSLKSYH